MNSVLVVKCPVYFVLLRLLTVALPVSHSHFTADLEFRDVVTYVNPLFRNILVVCRLINVPDSDCSRQ